MKPFVALSFVLACATAAPADLLAAGHHGLVHGAGHVAAVTHSVGPAPAGHGLTAGPVVPHAPVPYVAPPVPAPYTTHSQAEGVTTVHQPAPIVTKQVHLGQTSYVSGYETRIIKPPTPHLPISVPTVLRGSVAYNPAIVKNVAEVHNVQEPVLVERRVDAPYDAPFYTEKIIEVPTPVHVDAPYEVPVPVAVAGEPIIKHSVAPAVVTHSHHANVAAPAHAVAVGAHTGYSGLAGYYGHAAAALH